MLVWLWYRKGSFALKEQFDCPHLAASRVAALTPMVGRVDIFHEACMTQLAVRLLRGAIEVKPFSQRLLP